MKPKQSPDYFAPPFTGCPVVQVVPPSDFSTLSTKETEQAQSVQKIIEEHRQALEAELGSKFVFTQDPDLGKPVWLIGPRQCNPHINKIKSTVASTPQLFLDRDRKVLISDGKNPQEISETYSYLRSLARFSGGLWKIEPCQDIQSAIECIRSEIATSYPSFQLRELDWEKICQIHIPRVNAAAKDSEDSAITAMQTWVAELQDAHTWVRPVPPPSEMLYDLEVIDGRGYFYDIPEGTLAWELGVRPGDELLDQNYHDWWQRTAATAHSKPRVVGKRVLATPAGKARYFKSRNKLGKITEWEETPPLDRWKDPVSWKKLKNGNGYLRIKAWILGTNTDKNFDEALDFLKDCPKLIVDLRANPGGNLLMAHRFRNRFLDRSRKAGTLQHTRPDGTLSEIIPIEGEVPQQGKRWTKPAVFLTDEMTYSASEDALLGLQGQPNITVIGHSSGGGSGRARTIKLLPGYILTVSTYLTYDLKGRCVENHGIPVDKIVDPRTINLEDI